MRRTIALVGLLGVAAGACMKQDSGGLTQAEARAAGDSLGNGIEAAAATYGPLTSAAADAACVTLSGDTSDVDGDHIPADARLTYDCTSQALGYTGTMTGTLAVVDDQPAALAWAFTGSADMHAALTGSGGASLTSDWNGSLVGSQASAVGPYALDRSLDVVTVFVSGSDGGSAMTTTVTEANDWTVTFTPQATWTPGGIVVTGRLAAEGAWNVTVDEQTLTATLATPTPLTVDPACATLLTAGVVTGTYPLEVGGTGSVTVTWTGCGQRTVSRAG